MAGLALAAALASAFAACGGAEPPEDEAREKQGRAETQSIRNTDAVGYNGSAIADKVDTAITTTEEDEEKTRREVEEQTQ